MHTYIHTYIRVYLCACVHVGLCVCMLPSCFRSHMLEFSVLVTISCVPRFAGLSIGFSRLLGAVWVSAVSRCRGELCGMSAGFQQARNPTPGRARNHAAVLCSFMQVEGSSTMADVAYAPLQESIPFEKRAAEAGFVSAFQHICKGRIT